MPAKLVSQPDQNAFPLELEEGGKQLVGEASDAEALIAIHLKDGQFYLEKLSKDAPVSVGGKALKTKAEQEQEEQQSEDFLDEDPLSGSDLSTAALHHETNITIGERSFLFVNEDEAQASPPAEAPEEEATEEPEEQAPQEEPEPEEAEPAPSPQESVQEPVQELVQEPTQESLEASPSTPSPEQQSQTAVAVEEETALSAKDAYAGFDENLSQFNFQFDDIFTHVPQGVGQERWLLKILAGPNSGAQVPLSANKTYEIGTHPNSDIVLTDLSVSKKHARLHISEADSFEIEDLDSKNGVLVNADAIEGKVSLTGSALITLGASTLLVVDRENEQTTILTPPIPVKERIIVEKTLVEQPKEPLEAPVVEEKIKVAPKPKLPSGVLLLSALFAVLVTVSSLGVYMLFQKDEVEAIYFPQNEQVVSEILDPYQLIYDYNSQTGHLFLEGHIKDSADKERLIVQLKGLPFIRNIDQTNLVVDERVIKEYNPIIAKMWGSIRLESKKAGQYILAGEVPNISEADRLMSYLGTNFPFMNLLVNEVIVEEELTIRVNNILNAIAPNELLGEYRDGELLIVGTVPAQKAESYEKALQDFRKIKGVRSVRSLVNVKKEAYADGMVNLSDRYTITGSSKQADVNYSVIINGRILKRGDILDGMVVVSIRPDMVILEKEGVRYRIDYNP